MRRVIKKEYIPNSRSFKLFYSDGGIGYGADPSDDNLSTLVASIKNHVPSTEDLVLPQALPAKMNEAGEVVGTVPFVENTPEEDAMRKAKLMELGIETNNGIPVLSDENEIQLNDGLKAIELGAEVDERTQKLLDLMTEENE